MGCRQSNIVHPINKFKKQGTKDEDSTVDDTTTTQSNTYLNDDIIISKFLNVKDRINIQVADSQAFNKSFIHQRQQAVNNTSYRKTIESWKPNSLQQLVQMIKSLSNGKPIIDRHWIIFYWIAHNIEYDTVALFTKNYADQSAEGVFRTKKGVCAGYGNIYKYLCDQLQMPCEVVSGYAKGYGFDNRKGAPIETDHAWNAVEIDGHWYLIESTWGAGHLNDKKAFERELKSYYFLARPNEMIYDHLPEDEKWQLLERSIKMDEYMQMPKFYPPYFELNLELINPCNQAHVDFLPDRAYALVVIHAPDDVQLSCGIEYNNIKIKNGSLAQFNNEKKLWQLLFAPERTGQHELNVFGKRTSDTESSSTVVVKFNLDVTKIRRPMKFPTIYTQFETTKCQIYTPLDGILKKGSVVPIHCVIPNALEVSLKVDSEWFTNEGYTNPYPFAYPL
ncbi:unnamed protein product, partial [Adineta steineri]